MCGDPVEIDPTTPAEKWRYVCPNYHVRWRAVDSHIRCESCYDRGRTPTYTTIIDRRTGERIDWDRVNIVDD